MKKNFIIGILITALIAIVALELFGYSEDDFDRTYAEEIVDDIRDVLHLPKDEVFIKLDLDAPHPDEDVIYYGWVQGDAEVSQYVIHLTYRTNKYNLHKVLAHEMIHVKQMETGALVIGDKSVYFKGRLYSAFDIELLPYEERPWEIEAREGEKDVIDYLEAVEAGVLIQ